MIAKDLLANAISRLASEDDTVSAADATAILIKAMALQLKRAELDANSLRYEYFLLHLGNRLGAAMRSTDSAPPGRLQ